MTQHGVALSAFAAPPFNAVPSSKFIITPKHVLRQRSEFRKKRDSICFLICLCLNVSASSSSPSSPPPSPNQFTFCLSSFSPKYNNKTNEEVNFNAAYRISCNSHTPNQTKATPRSPCPLLSFQNSISTLFLEPIKKLCAQV